MTPRSLWPALTPTLAAVSASLQDAFADELTRYTDHVRESEQAGSAKIINDPVWRTIRLEAWETVILDSPLVQRLRRIHQLGLAGEVFPGANYSRFEHSLGVLHQSQRVVEAINRNARSKAARLNVPADEPVSKAEEVLLRIAALTHDIGHGFMSHVSERAIARLKTIGARGSIRQFRIDASEFFECNKAPAVAEALSSLIVILPQFVDLLSVANVPYWSDVRHLAINIAKLICGTRTAQRPFLTEIISGAVDADKLDYMPRDCYMAGLPMPIDVDRLLEKLHVVRVPANSLPQDYLEGSSLTAADSVQVLAVETGGARAFEEMVLSRLFLYDKLYYHQKVRAIEGMLLNALELLAESDPQFRDPSTFLRISDEELLRGHWTNRVTDPSPSFNLAVSLMADIGYRRTFVRSFAFGPSLVSHPNPNDERAVRSNWEALEPFVSATRDDYVELRRDIAVLAREYLSAVGQPAVAASLRDQHIVVDLPDVQGITEKTKFFVGDEQLGVQTYAKRFRVERWAEAYESQKTIGYIYSAPEFAMAVHFAARDVIRSRFDLSFEDSSWSRTKLSPLKLRDFGDILTQRVKNSPRFELPKQYLDSRQHMESIQRKSEWFGVFAQVITDLAGRFRTFESATGNVVRNPEIQEWLVQFDYADIPLAIRVLQSIQFWDRSAFADGFVIGLEQQFPVPGVLQCLALGGPTTSSHHLTYLWPDVIPRLSDRRITILEGAHGIRIEVPLILYDDNVGRGWQGSTVLMQWFGRPQSEWEVNEIHVEPLPAEILDLFRSCPIRFLFLTGLRSGLSHLIETVRRLTGNNDVGGLIVSPTDVGCFRAASRVFENRAEAIRAEDVFRSVGLRALDDRVTDWGRDKVADRVLGYGNAAGITVFNYNTPTTTLTAFWKDCQTGSGWKALFPRRPR